MRGPTFDPGQVDPLIREFYEHTTRFKLSIVPVWKLWMKPLFWLYKQMVAQQMGQANLPFNQEEAQRLWGQRVALLDVPRLGKAYLRILYAEGLGTADRIMTTPAVLALADGTVFDGVSIGIEGISDGEVVFNTAMTG